MGKTTSNGLKRSHSAKVTNTSMAPEKIWSSETTISSDQERCSSTFYQFVQDKTMRRMDMGLQKNINDNMLKNMFKKDQNDNISGHESACRLHDNIISNKNEVNNNTKVESQCPNLISDCEEGIINDCEEGITLDKEFNYVHCNKLNSNLTDSTFMCKAFLHDHPYAFYQTQPSAFEDNNIDVCSDCTTQSEETEQFYPLSLNCKNSKFGINEDLTGTLDFEEQFRTCSNLLSPSSSISSLTSDMASKTSHSVFSGDEIDDIFTGISSPESASSNPISATSNPISAASNPTSAVFLGKPAVKNEKFRNDTSASSLVLEKFLTCKNHINNNNFSSRIPTDSHLINSVSCSPSTFQNVQSLLLSPSLDWDRSEVDSEILDDSSDARTPLRMSPDLIENVAEWFHPVFHDHDYCVKRTESYRFSEGYGQSESFSLSGEFRKCKKQKRKDTTNKLDKMKLEKIKTAKYLNKELLRRNRLINCVLEHQTVTTDHTGIKTNPVGRPKKRPLNKIFDEEIDPETGKKLKITGKFQDQYVYYLSKSSRTTTRGRQTSASSLTSDTLIPASNPGDIIVPHLTDADLEAVRLKGCDALNLSERSNHTCVTHPLPIQSVIPHSIHSNDFISDVDNNIVSTILSMEQHSLFFPARPQTPTIINTEGLNPNQPALTESLRLMSGDSSITSEHVLNYLLSVLKDDRLFEGGCEFDTSSSVLYPAIPPDSLNLRTELTGETENVMFEELTSLGSKSVPSSRSFDNQALFSTTHIREPHDYTHTHSMDETDCLHADLSTFMSESKRTLPSSPIKDDDSHSLMKDTLECDFNSLGKPQLSSSVDRVTSIENTLGYLCDEAAILDSKIRHDLPQTLTQLANPFVDDAPWIVTVTLYFNDVPAIIINNQPYIRLVDIHKQILPAKDTGILKKRCQLLKLPILNCTEMQRYFLVQYARAYNSKSSLIISKNHATDLVTYYATPQSRMSRVSEAQQCRNSRTQNVRLPVAHLSVGRNRRHGGRRAKSATGLFSLPASDDIRKSPSQLPPQDGLSSQKCEVLTSSYGQRTRHKKISYLDLLKGAEKVKLSASAILGKPECEVNYVLGNSHDEKSIKTHRRKKVDGTCNTKNNFTNRKCASLRKKTNETEDKRFQNVEGRKYVTMNKDKHVTTGASYVCLQGDCQDSSDFSGHPKVKPLKLKLKSLLNSARHKTGSLPSKKGPLSHNKSFISSTSDRPLRVLPVAHQTPLFEIGAESCLPSQPADIYLDLFVKSNSPCVCCGTCSQFLSIPHFMRHHHVQKEGEKWATEVSQRVLVPRNKNFSQQEFELWAEFHRLQEEFGGFREADDETDDDQSSLDITCCDDIEKTLLDLSETPSYSRLNVDRSFLCMETRMKGKRISRSSSTSHDSTSMTESFENHNFLQLDKKSATVSNPSLNEKLSNENITKSELKWRDVGKTGLSAGGLFSGVVDSNTLNTRTSTRKRKSKQLFSIENYYTPKKWVVGEEIYSSKPV